MSELLSFILLVGMLILVVSAFFNDHLPVWYCNQMGWHLTPKEQGFNGKCPRCGKSVMQDSQGNWF